jgi:hypothetical protein
MNIISCNVEVEEKHTAASNEYSKKSGMYRQTINIESRLHFTSQIEDF